MAALPIRSRCELALAALIDRETHDAAHDDAGDFEPRAGTQLRGLRAPHDLYVLAP